MTRIVQFVVLVFALSWAFWFAASLAAPPLALLLFLAGTVTPALVALWLSARARGGPGARALLEGVLAWRVDLRWYVFALVFMAAVKLASAGVHRLVAGAWPEFTTTLIPLL